jgi:hypothetical protein
MHALPLEELERLRPESAPVLAVTRSLAGVPCLGQQSKPWAKLGPTRLQHTPADEPRQSVDGLETIVAQTLGLDTGAMRRFPTVGPSTS